MFHLWECDDYMPCFSLTVNTWPIPCLNMLVDIENDIVGGQLIKSLHSLVASRSSLKLRLSFGVGAVRRLQLIYRLWLVKQPQ